MFGISEERVGIERQRLEQTHKPEDGIIKLNDRFDGLPRDIISGLGDVECGKHRRHEQPDGSFHEDGTRASPVSR
jgi:hypothetical protein